MFKINWLCVTVIVSFFVLQLKASMYTVNEDGELEKGTVSLSFSKAFVVNGEYEKNEFKLKVKLKSIYKNVKLKTFKVYIRGGFSEDEKWSIPLKIADFKEGEYSLEFKLPKSMRDNSYIEIEGISTENEFYHKNERLNSYLSRDEDPTFKKWANQKLTKEELEKYMYFLEKAKKKELKKEKQAQSPRKK